MTILPYRQFRGSGAPARCGTGLTDIDRVFDNFFRNALTNLSGPPAALGDLSLRLDVTETDKAYTVKADLPGMEEKDVAITLEDGVLTISGEKTQEQEEEGKTFHRIERSYGTFRRALTLPADADETGIAAHMKNGVLEIEIAKAPEAPKSAKRIEVKAKR